MVEFILGGPPNLKLHFPVTPPSSIKFCLQISLFLFLNKKCLSHAFYVSSETKSQIVSTGVVYEREAVINFEKFFSFCHKKQFPPTFRIVLKKGIGKILIKTTGEFQLMWIT